MRIIDTELFIGGAADGRRYTVDGPLRAVIVEVLPPESARVGGPGVSPVVPVQREDYRREALSTPTACFTFWVAKGVGTDDAIERLFDHYPAERRR